jgi:tRNA1Val (adenine37-N6)-methyltransferase
MKVGKNESMDVILDGRIKIIQRHQGYRLNEDSLHLCRFVRPMPDAVGIDLGTGCGVVAIVLAAEGKAKRMVGLELQDSLTSLAERNVILNGLSGRVEVVRGDIRKVERLFPPGSFQMAVSNPPYREIGRGRLSPSSEKAVARHEWSCSLEDLVKAASYLLPPEGIMAFCHLPERWEEIAKTLDRFGFQVSRREDVGQLVLVEAVKV